MAHKRDKALAIRMRYAPGVKENQSLLLRVFLTDHDKLAPRMIKGAWPEIAAWVQKQDVAKPDGSPVDATYARQTWWKADRLHAKLIAKAEQERADKIAKAAERKARIAAEEAALQAEADAKFKRFVARHRGRWRAAPIHTPPPVKRPVRLPPLPPEPEPEVDFEAEMLALQEASRLRAERIAETMAEIAESMEVSRRFDADGERMPQTGLGVIHAEVAAAVPIDGTDDPDYLAAIAEGEALARQLELEAWRASQQAASSVWGNVEDAGREARLLGRS